MGIIVYSLLWVMQDLYHQPFHRLGFKTECAPAIGGDGNARPMTDENSTNATAPQRFRL